LSENILKLFKSELKVVNVGLDIFYKAMRDQGVKCVQVKWQPPPKLEKKLEEALEKML